MNEKSINPTVALLKRLSLAVGVTGYTKENNIQQIFTTELMACTTQLESKSDKMGSVVALKLGSQSPLDGKPRRKIMITAHLDEIGAMVSQIDRGFLRFQQIGALDERVLLGQEVMVHAQRDLPGVIGATPPHLIQKSTNRVDKKDLLIDVGLSAADVEKIVRLGDLISFVRTPEELQNNLLSAKAMDNRASLAAMIICLQELNKLQHQWDVYAVATADEEWGYYVGATTQSYAIHPDVAIVVDVTFADVSENDIKLGNGPVISLGPSNHSAIRKRLLEICEKLELKYQNEVIPVGGGTEVYAIEVSREGVPAILVSIPSRYMHTPIETVHPKDIERTGRLIAYFIASLDETFIETLTAE